MCDRKCPENQNEIGKYLDWPYQEHICTLHWLPHQAVNLYPNCQYHHIPHATQVVHPPCLLKHGIPLHITSDCGTEFVSTFFHSLSKVLDMKHSVCPLPSGYHPEGNGQTERANQTLEQYLWVYCNYQQSNWSYLLPVAEFAYNNAPNATTGLSPFYANKGYHSNLSVHPECVKNWSTQKPKVELGHT